MYKKKRILAIIPARGGSKGLPGKNIKSICGKPLIAWTIAQARQSVLLDEIIVSTDSRLIADLAEKHGAPVPFLRPRPLATDTSKIADTIIYTLERLEKSGKTFDYVALLEPTSPLRKRFDIDRGIRLLIGHEKGFDSLVSVGEIALEHPKYAKSIDKNGYLLPYFQEKETDLLRQALIPAYFPYGVLYLSKVPVIKKYKAAYAGKIMPMHIERWQNYEINDIYDFILIEQLLRRKKGELK